ncbi:carbohydrate esterase family 4 protein [Gelatoporia subvermispora B]|uniref:chitin deacetylase n=1 Tax=Ceriporiopsis subvermispora (strain B) TaxID=914234 RepID=M2RT65_CERS8|nr:carbohydrate esterase family 4 protein [Gelatoporia subvermispora B]
MRFAVVSALAVPALVSAHGFQGHARQAPASSAPAAAATTAAAPAASSAPVAASGSASGASSGVLASALSGSLTFTPASVNPTAVPLSEIIPGTVTTQSTVPLLTTPTAGATPSAFPSAPPLPDISTINPANYPTLDKTPPTDSALVQQWIQDVQNTGIHIPDIEPTVLGGCPANPVAAADANKTRCWWTCGGCTADGDVTTCPDKLTWGLTYDDGPAPYTPSLLQYLEANNLTGTIFTVGSRAISYPNTLRDEYISGHQIAVHTWSHPYMTTLSNDQVIAELGWSKKIIKDVLGVTPNFWRPPYGDVDNRVRAIATAMGLQTSMWTRISPTATFDTGDYDVAGGLVSPYQVLNNWDSIMGNASTIDTGFIVLEHDLFAQSVDLATGYILPQALARNPPLKIMPIVECLNKPMSDAYIETNDNTTNPPIASGGATAATFSSGAQQTGSSATKSNGAVAASYFSPDMLTSAMGLLAGLGAIVL